MKNVKIIQVLSALILYYNCLCTGLMIGWPSSSMVLFKLETTPLHRPMTDTEISLSGSVSSIGGLIGTPLAGILLDKLGRKRSALLVTGIITVIWITIIFSNRVEIILAALMLSGLCSATYLTTPIFLSEIAEESIRGTLTSGAIAFTGLGMLLAYLFGDIFSYTASLYISLTMTVVAMMLILILKESPTLLMKKGMNEEAKKAMGFYRSSHPNSKIVSKEIEKIRRALSYNDKVTETQSPEEKALNSEDQDERPPQKLSVWQFFKSSKATQRQFMTAMLLVTLAVFQGMLILLIYAKLLFTATVPAEVLSATWCCILLCLVSVVSGLISAYLLDVVGRRSMMLFSSISSGICCLLIGTQVELHWGPEWFIPLFMYLFNACYTLGTGTFVLVISAEMFLPEVKSVLSMITFEWYITCNFVICLSFNHLVGAIGLGPVFYIFSGFSLLTTIFCYFFLPEIKGLTVDEIQLLFVKPKNNNLI